MTRIYKNQLFRGLNLREPVAVHDMELVKCTFRDCNLWTLEDPSRRAIVQNVSAIGCQIFGEGSRIRGAAIEECVIDGLQAGGLVRFDGCVFKHVMLRGRIGKVMVTNEPFSVPEPIAQQFVEANLNYYANVDWALDISEAVFDEQLALRGLPSALVRRDPRRHVVVTRERAQQALWSNIDLHPRVQVFLAFIVRRGWPDEVFVLPDRHSDRQSMLDCLTRLRELGIAEPN